MNNQRYEKMMFYIGKFGATKEQIEVFLSMENNFQFVQDALAFLLEILRHLFVGG